MHNVDRPKRTLPTPTHSFAFKRAKTEYSDVKLDSPAPLPLSAPQGVERIRLPAVRRLSSQCLEQLASERTATLHGQGRRVVGLPLVLDDGIVLNWVRPKSGSARPTATSYKKEMPRPLVSPGRGSGTSAVDAIIIDSDEDASSVSSHSRTVVPGVIPINRDTPPNRDVVDSSDLDVESLPSPRRRLENKAENNQPSSHQESPYQENTRASNAPCNRASTRAKATISDSEPDETDEVVSETVNGSKISPLHRAEPPLPSLQPASDSHARGKRRGCPHRPEGTIVTPQVSQKQGEKELPNEATPHSSSTSDEETVSRVSDPQLKRVLLPKTVHGRPRRLLKPDSADLPLVAVTMRGDCHFIERKKKYRISGYSLPNPGVFRHVSDVCMVGNTAVLGCDKGTNQISFLSVAGKPQMVNVACSPHSSSPRYQGTPRRGVTCLAAIHAKDGHIKFLSGGYDGTVHKWMAGVEKLDEPRFEKIVSYVASAQKTLRITDLNRQRTREYAFSNDIQQIHIHPQESYVTLLEVRHLDHQIQLYDSRKANFDTEPCLSFGYRNTNNKFPATHTRGSVHLIHFAMASEDGCVLLWDFRYTKRAMVERQFQQAENVVHTIFADRDIATFGQGVVTFFEDY